MKLKRLRSKLRSSRGLTLVEMLSTLAIVVLLTMLVSVGVSLATRTYTQSVELSEAKVLHSTLSNVISSELAQTSTIKLASTGPGEGGGERVDKFFSKSYGVKDDLCSFGVIAEEGKDYGELTLGSDSTQNKLISSTAYTNDTGAKVNVVYYRKNTETGKPEHFAVTLSIYSKDGTELVANTFDVVPYNAVNPI